MRRLVCLIVAAVALAGAVSADRLELENGDVVSGTIVRMDDQVVVIDTGFGTLEVPRERVARGEFGSSSDGDGGEESDAGTSAADSAADDLVFAFPLDGTLADSTGTHTLTNNGMTFTADASGAAGRALRSDGQGTYLSVAPGQGLDGLTAFTLVFRVRLDSTQGTRYLVSKWSRADGETADGKFTLQTSGGALTYFLVAPDGRYYWLAAPGVLDASAWHTVAISFGAGRAAIVVDGVEVRARTFSFTELASDDAPLLFMTAEASTDDPYGHYNASGSIDDLRLYSRALSTSEIAAIGTGLVTE